MHTPALTHLENLTGPAYYVSIEDIGDLFRGRPMLFKDMKHVLPKKSHRKKLGI